MGSDLFGKNRDGSTIVEYPKTMTVLELVNDFAGQLGVEMGRIRLWVIETRHNKTLRPDSLVSIEHHGDDTLFQLLKSTSNAEKASPIYIHSYNSKHQLTRPNYACA